MLPLGGHKVIRRNKVDISCKNIEPCFRGFSLRTEAQLLSRVWGQREAEDCHGSDEETRHDQVEEIVESSPPDFDNVGDVKVGLGATVVDNLVSLGRNSWG